MYDSRPDTYAHIRKVAYLLNMCAINLIKRGQEHDASKLLEPELSAFNELTPVLGEVEYGSDEYKATLKRLGPALTHHYDVNAHHPQHWPHGIADMSLLDLVEMLCDWYATSQRVANGDILKSIDINQERFRFSDDLKQLFINSLAELGMEG